MKLQLALDYMIVFGFVIIVFVYVFAYIGNQQVLEESQQSISQLQAIAQSIAQQINIAQQSGNGYFAAVSAPQQLGIASYNVTITQGGLVIASENQSGKIVQAVASSLAPRVISSPSFQTRNSNTFTFPGGQRFTFQNSFGNICINYICPNTTNQGSTISLTEQVTHAATFNSSYAAITSGPTYANEGTVGAWVYPVNSCTSANCDVMLTETVGSSSGWGSLLRVSNGYFWAYVHSTSTYFSVAYKIPAYNKWYYISQTYNGATQVLYVNGVPVNSVSESITPVTTDALYIGSCWPGPTCASSAPQTYNGTIANLQVYSGVLTNGEINTIVSRGIGGAPLSNSLLGWWPLNGNANDYSGNGNNGQISGSVTFPTVAQISARVTNATGTPIANDLVGFTTTLGTFSGNQLSASNLTNANGIATTILNQNANSGSAIVKAIAYNGNVTNAPSLTGWWPLNTGSGSNALDVGYHIAQNGINTGILRNTSWALPNYVAAFDGQTAFVRAYSALINTTSAGYNTVTFWMKWAGGATTQMLFGSRWPNNYALEILPVSTNTTNTLINCLGFSSANNDNWGFNATSLKNRWVFVAAEFYNGAFVGKSRIYINGNNMSGLLGCGSRPAVSRTMSNVYQISGWAVNNQYIFNGSLADVQVYNALLTSNQISSLYSGGLSAPPLANGNFIAWYPLSGDANDYSGKGNNGTIGGNLQFVNPPVQQNATLNTTQGAYFNGKNSYVITSSAISPYVNQQVSGITTSVWFYMAQSQTAESSNFGTLISTSNCGVDLYFKSGTTIEYTDGCAHGNTGTYLFSPNRWYNLVATITNGTSPTVTYYVNGVKVNQGSASAWTSTSSQLCIGTSTVTPSSTCSGGTLSYFFNGTIANAQIYNSVLTPSQASQEYLNGIEGFPVSNTIAAWYPLNGNVRDYSGNGNYGTATNVIYKSVNPTYYYSNGNYGVNFNGGSSNVTVPNSNTLQLSTMTLAAWVRLSGYPTGTANTVYGTIIDKTSYCAITDTDFPYRLVVTSSGDVSYQLSGGHSFSDSSIVTSSSKLSLNQWYFVTATYNGLTQSLYVNGQQAATPATYGEALPINNEPFEIGRVARYGSSSCGSMDWFNGTIADVQAYNTSMTANQVYQLYVNGLPPTATATVPMGVLQ